MSDTHADKLPLIDGIEIDALELKLSGGVSTEPDGHHEHGDVVYLLVQGHISDIRHPEQIEDGIRVGITRQEIVKADGAWLVPVAEGRALVELSKRRAFMRRSGGQVPFPDNGAHARVVNVLSRAVDEARALFPGTV